MGKGPKIEKHVMLRAVKTRLFSHGGMSFANIWAHCRTYTRSAISSLACASLQQFDLLRQKFAGGKYCKLYVGHSISPVYVRRAHGVGHDAQKGAERGKKHCFSSPHAIVSPLSSLPPLSPCSEAAADPRAEDVHVGFLASSFLPLSSSKPKL